MEKKGQRHKLSELLYILISQIRMLHPWIRKLYYFIHVHASTSTLPILGLQVFEQGSSVQIIFTVTKQKSIGNRPVEEVKKMKCYKRLIYKQFVQVSGLCGPKFLSYLPKRFTHLCRALYGAAILVHRFGAPI